MESVARERFRKRHVFRQSLIGEFHSSALFKCFNSLFVWHFPFLSRRVQCFVAVPPCAQGRVKRPLPDCSEICFKTRNFTFLLDLPCRSATLRRKDLVRDFGQG